MKFVVFCILFSVALTLGVAEGTRCRSAEDCEEDECCIGRAAIGFKKGDCKKLSQKGEKCSHEDDVLWVLGEQYAYNCPCASGLACEPTEVKEMPFDLGTIRINERCVDGVTEQPEPSTVEPEPETQPEPEPTEE